MHDASDITIRAALPQEWPAAISLALQHLGQDARPARLQNTLALVAQGVIDANGIFIASDARGLRGVQICVPLAGASALFWLPSTVPANVTLEDRLVQTALEWVHGRGAKIAQAIISPLDRPFSGGLQRRGFRHVTNLHYFEHSLRSLPLSIESRLRYDTYSAENRDLFHDVLVRTYHETRDCPELNGVRTIQEVIAGHQGQGVFRPERWFLAFEGAQPVGVAMLAEIPDLGGWDLEYIGVLPEMRRRGLGRELTSHLLHVAKTAGAAKLLLAVDERNRPAVQLYERLGFVSLENREVFLYFWDGPLAAALAGKL